MNHSSKQNYKLIAILASAIAAGLPLWTNSARMINFTDPLFLAIWLFSGVLAGCLLPLIIRLNMRDMISSFVVGYVISVIVYFVGLILLKNLFHSQFLLSLLVAIGSGILSAWIGSLIWSWIRLPRKKHK